MTDRNHRDEHPGCPHMWPWLGRCSLWASPILLQRCRHDIAQMPAASRRSHYVRMATHRNSLSKASSKSAYISWVDGWDTQEADMIRTDCRNLGARFSRSEDEIALHTQEVLAAKTQQKAHAVLFAYGLLDRDGNLKTG